LIGFMSDLIVVVDACACDGNITQVLASK